MAAGTGGKLGLGGVIMDVIVIIDVLSSLIISMTFKTQDVCKKNW